MPNKDVHIVDASHWRWPTDLNLLVANNEKAYITKCTDGATWTDDYFDDWQQQAEALDLPFGSFHYWRVTHSAPVQAKYYFDKATAWKRPLFPPIIDIEKYNNFPGMATPANASAHLQEVVIETERLWGEKPWLYTSYYAVKDILGNPDWMKNYFLWVASYRDDAPSIPVPWQQTAPPQYKMWQHTTTWKIPGAGFAGYDGDWWWGDQASFDKFVAEREPEPPPPPVEYPFPGKVLSPTNLNIFDAPMGVRVGLLKDGCGVYVKQEETDADGVKWYKLGSGSFVKSKYIKRL